MSTEARHTLYADIPAQRRSAFVDLVESDEHYADLSGDPTMTRERWEAERPEREAEDEAYAINALRDLLIGHGCPAPYVDVIVLPVLLKAFRVIERREFGALTGSGMLVHLANTVAEDPRPAEYRSMALYSDWKPADV